MANDSAIIVLGSILMDLLSSDSKYRTRPADDIGPELSSSDIIYYNKEQEIFIIFELWLQLLHFQYP